MENNPYKHTMDSIKPPASLKNKVLAEINEIQDAEVQPEKRKIRVLPIITLGGVAAAVCLVAVALMGGITAASAPVLGNTSGDGFSIMAYASEPTMRFASKEGAVVFGAAIPGSSGEETGMYTGCLFDISGEDIVSVEASITKGGLYLSTEEDYLRDQSDPDNETTRNEAVAKSELRMGGGATSLDDYGRDYSDCTLSAGRLMGSQFSFPCGADQGSIDLSQVQLGFWVAPEDQAPNEVWDENLRVGWHQTLDSFDGEVLSVTVEKQDGSRFTESYVLSVGKMKLDQAEDGTMTVLPEFAGDNETYIYAIYGTVAA